MPGRVAGPDGVADAGVGLHDIGGDAAGFQIGVMHAGIARHVLAHVVDADAHEFDGVERAAPEVRGRGRMRGAAREDEVGAGVGEGQRGRHLPEARGMPGDRDIGVVEGTGPHHEGLGGPAFLGRAAVVAHAAGRPGLGQPVLDRGRGQQGGRTEQVVPAAMAMAAGLDRLRRRDARLLAEARQGIVFPEDRDHGSALARFAHDGGGDAGHGLGDAKALVAQFGHVLGRRTVLGVADFRHAPDAVGQSDQAVLLLVDVAPE